MANILVRIFLNGQISLSPMVSNLQYGPGYSKKYIFSEKLGYYELFIVCTVQVIVFVYILNISVFISTATHKVILDVFAHKIN